uniref:Uncharacterized protein n=1 Tax=Lepeophtheirus salmonis TaxID=72036 RepID=A0A0K2TVM2_LEPSM
MVLSLVASDGSNMPPYFFKANEKVNTDVYYRVLWYYVLPWLKSTFPGTTMCLPKTASRHTRPRRCRISTGRI